MKFKLNFASGSSLDELFLRFHKYQRLKRDGIDITEYQQKTCDLVLNLKKFCIDESGYVYINTLKELMKLKATVEYPIIIYDDDIYVYNSWME